MSDVEAFLFMYAVFVLLPALPWAARLLVGIVRPARQEQEEQIAGKPGVVVTLVHGTWAQAAPGTKKGSALREALTRSYENDIGFIRHPWTGSNSFRARREAAKALRTRLEQAMKDHPKARHLVIAHSHGGNVALMAAGGHVPEEIAGIACLATPVLVSRGRQYDPLTAFALRWIAVPLAIDILFVLEWLKLAGGEVFLFVLGGAFLLVYVVRRFAPKLEGIAPSPVPRDKIAFFRSPGDEASLAISATNLIGLALDKLVTAPLVGIDRMTKGAEALRTRLRSRPLWPLLAVVLLPAALGIWWAGFQAAADMSGITGYATALAVLSLVGVLALPAAVHLRLHYLLYVYAFFFAIALLPLLIVGAGLLGLAVGRETSLAAVAWHVTAEVCPPGDWKVINIPDDGSGIVHSAIYQDEAALAELTRWAKERTNAAVTA